MPCNLERWKKAVVHLECATDSSSARDLVRRLRELREKHQAGDITAEQLSDGIASAGRDVRFTGTSLFVRHEGRRFLITARHVLWDDIYAEHELREQEARATNWPEDRRREHLARERDRALEYIFSIIYRVPTLDEIVESTSRPLNEFLMNLGAGVPSHAPYTFSVPETDLAVISLDQRDSRFSEELERKGHTPISSEDFVDAPSSEGAEVFTVGFPGATAILGERPLHPALVPWASAAVCVPTFAFGRVSMLHPCLEYFWCDMSAYPGNSGGPVIEEDRLVGIVSAQPTIPLEGEGVADAAARIPFAKVIRASHIFPLLEQQLEKDRRSST